MTLKQTCFNIVLFLCASPALAQNWANAGVPLTVSEVRCTYVDTVSNNLYISGSIPYGVGIGNAAFCKFNGSSWSYQDTVNNVVFAIQKYHNELYIGGAFTTINGQPFSYLAKWNGGNWINIGICNGSILNLKVFNDELYAVGNFTTIAGVNANKIAKFDGTSWTNLNFPYCNDPAWAIADCAIYKNELYVGGNFENANGQSDIAVLKSGSWKRVGGNSDSLRGSFGGVNKLEVYHNYLYAAGLILENEGNIGNGIQAWDGQKWNKVAAGIQGPDNTVNSTSQIQDMIQYKGKLYVTGNFYYIDHIPSRGLGVWDGVKWCSIDGSFDRAIGCFEIFRDTIYIGTYYTVEGVFVNGFARFVSGNYTYTDSCGSAFYLGIKEENNNNEPLLYPNPTNSIIKINEEQNELQNSTIEITNSIGQSVMSFTYTPSIDLSGLSSGCYFMHITTEQNRVFHSKFIKQ